MSPFNFKNIYYSDTTNGTYGSISAYIISILEKCRKEKETER